MEEMRQHPTWNDQIVGGYASYWIYQHLGNLPPEELSRDDLYNEVREAEDAWSILREFAYNAHRGPDGARWSFHRDLGNTRLLMIDSRGGRVLQEDKRSMVDAEEWARVHEKASGDFDHLLIGTSLPLLLGPGMHHLQSWDERLCSGAWGARTARWAETFRRSQDLDHWASFHDSFAAMVRLIRDVASGKKGDPPSTVLILSGDVHHGYLAEATLDNSTKSHVYQAVCSPLRNALPKEKSFLQNIAWTGLAALTGRFLARLARIPHEPISWRMTHNAAFFENQIATLELDDRSATITFEKAVLDASKEPALEKLYRFRLA